MWVLEACFEDDKAPFRKFLKPGEQYHFGRKAPADLILADKTVSKESATIYVGAYKPDQEHNAPTLTVHALKRSIRFIDAAHEAEWEGNREGFIGENIEPDSRRRLKSGDIVVLTRSAPSVKVLWMPLVFGVSAKISKEEVEKRKPECTSLGIGMERSKQYVLQTTHLVLPSPSMLTAPLMQALMAAAHLVTLEYVDEVLRRAKLEAKDAKSLEKRFHLPDAEGYFPEDIEIEGMLKPQVAQALAVNERRRTMFVGTTFLFVYGEDGMGKSLETSMQLCKAGRGRVVVESAARIKDDEMVLRVLRRNLSEAQSLLAECGEAASEAPDEGLVVICGMDDFDTDWYKKLIHSTRLLKIAMPKEGPVAVSKAILHADPRRFLNHMAIALAEEQWPQSTNAETLPPTAPVQQVPATLPAATFAMDLDAEGTQRPSAMEREPSPTLTTVTSTSAAASGTQKSPRKPRRRADMVRQDPFDDIFGASAPSSVTATDADALSATGGEAPPSTSTTRHTARPRRHDGTDNKRPRVSETWRSIFEPEPHGTQGMDHDGVPNTYDESSQSKTRKYRMELDEADRLATQKIAASHADGEQSQAASIVGDKAEEATRKRRAQSPVLEESQPARQRQRQLEEMEQGREASKSKEPSPTATATASAPTTSLANTVIHGDRNGSLIDKTGNSDTDAKFLQAMATSKRSKKGMDQFDKEFNLLRIARPAHRTGHHGKIIADVDDPEYRAWEQMGASDFDINAAGNFVQVDFVPLIYHRSEEEEEERARRLAEVKEKWNGQPNYKKFRTKERPQRRVLAMDVEECLDYGLGDRYAKAPKASMRVARGTATFSDDDEDVHEAESMGPPPKPGPSRKKKSYQEDPFSDDDNETQPIAPSRRSTQTISATATQRQQRKKTTLPEVEGQNASQSRRAVDVRLDIDGDLDDSIYRTRPQPRAPPSVSSSTTITSSKRGTIELSSDEEDEAGGFSGFRKKRRS